MNKEQAVTTATDSFYQCLTKERSLSGEEYYWKNQAQLQASALTFKTLIDSSPQQYLNSKQDEKGYIYKDIPSPNFLQPAKDRFSAIKYMNQEQNHPTPLSEKQQCRQTILSIKNKMLFEESIFIPSKLRIKNIEKRQSILPSIYRSWRSQHLYQEKEQIEIAVRIPISPSKWGQFKTSLKQWLATKNLRLKNLIINGVKQ